MLGVLAASEPFGMAPEVLASMTRIVTNRRVFADPDTPENAVAFAASIVGQPHCHMIHSGPRAWEIFCDLCRSSKAKGSLVQDAWFAALAIESGCTWITLDRDFARFPGLRWREPS